MAEALGFTEDDLRYAAGPTSYARGLGYLNQVEDLQIAGTRVTATVFGNDAYEVRLTFGDTGPGASNVDGDCSCPFGAEGNFCKHCVAVGLVALKTGDSLPLLTQAGPHPERQLLVSWLGSLTKDELLAELLELADADPALRRRFELRAAAQQADVEAVRNAVQRLIWVTDYIGYDEARDYATDVSSAANAIAELIDASASAQAIAVARDAIDWFRQCFGAVDDSSGDIGSAGLDLLDVHLLACQAAPPDQLELASYLGDLCLTDSFGLTPELEDYTELLGDAGAAALHDRIAAAYEANPGDYHVQYLMESVTEAEGDVDALVALYAAHLDERGWQHLRIAHKLDEAGRPDEALEWAERGARSGPRPDTRLVDYLVDRYTAAARTDDVLKLRRTLFAGDRTLANYQALRQAATQSGGWDSEREAALDLLRGDAEAVPRTAWSPWAWGGPILIDALIDDRDLAAAWTAAQHAASEAQWTRLADASINDRPADALAVYLRVIERLAENTGDGIYRQIAAHLVSARACHEALGTIAEFRQYMAWLRIRQKRKRNLMKILDQNGL